MSHTISFKVSGHTITPAEANPEIIQSNTNYVFEFTLDSEWTARGSVVAVFKHPNGDYVDVPLSDGKAACPAIADVGSIEVGLYSDASTENTQDFISTTSTSVKVKTSIMSGRGAELDGSVYTSTAKLAADLTARIAALTARVEELEREGEDR